MSRHLLNETQLDGLRAFRLASADGALTTTFVPGAGMVGASLTHEGEEVLAERGGLSAYLEAGKTFGIPLLHPWANRVDDHRYRACDVEVDLRQVSQLVHTDANGLPIHGLAAGCPDWHVFESVADDSSARLAARLEVGPDSAMFPGFPFPHAVEMRVRLTGSDGGGRVVVEARLSATGNRSVPVTFGWHPYFQLPGVARRDWVVDLPVGQHYVLDARSLPTGERQAVTIDRAPLGDRTYDDLFDELRPSPEGPPVFTLEGGGRRISVSFERGCPFAIVWAPPGSDLICFEPMAAATNALATGWPELKLLQPGESHVLRFAIEVGGV